MSAVCQLKLPPELQDLIRTFAYYSKTELRQRCRKEHMIGQLNRCKRVTGKLTSIEPYFDLFYYNMEQYTCFLYNELIYLEYYYSTMKVVFCKECHNYVSCNTEIPRCIECNCMPEILDVD